MADFLEESQIYSIYKQIESVAANPRIRYCDDIKLLRIEFGNSPKMLDASYLDKLVDKVIDCVTVVDTRYLQITIGPKQLMVPCLSTGITINHCRVSPVVGLQAIYYAEGHKCKFIDKSTFSYYTLEAGTFSYFDGEFNCTLQLDSGDRYIVTPPHINSTGNITVVNGRYITTEIESYIDGVIKLTGSDDPHYMVNESMLINFNTGEKIEFLVLAKYDCDFEQKDGKIIIQGRHYINDTYGDYLVYMYYFKNSYIAAIRYGVFGHYNHNYVEVFPKNIAPPLHTKPASHQVKFE